MPTYEYKCTNCEHALEALQKISDSPLLSCPRCDKNSLKRGPGGGIGLSFKGSGFYITDYGPCKNRPKEKGCCRKEGKKCSEAK